MKKENLRPVGRLATWNSLEEGVFFDGSYDESQDWVEDEAGNKIKYYLVKGSTKNLQRLVDRGVAVPHKSDTVIIKLRY